MLAIIVSALLVAFRPKELEECDALPALMILGFMEIGFEGIAVMMLIFGGCVS